MISRGPDGYYHPANEAELASLIRQAHASGRKLRVRGAGHSVPGAFEAGVSGMNVLLDRMFSVEFDDDGMQVTVQAGCHLGYDPEDPSRTSTRENGLFAQLDRRGWALPDTGGISRQTVAGFLSTGSSGSSVQHAPNEAVVKIRLVDGTGEAHEFPRTEDASAPFFGAGVSMGLLGVITAVTLKCVPRYIVSGNERTSSYDDCAIDLFGSGSPGGRPSLETFFRQTEHGRLLWWPQKGVRKMMVWQGQQMAVPAGFKPKPYRAMRTIFGSSYPAYLAISLSMRLLDSLNPPAPRGWLLRRSEKALAQLYTLIAGGILKASGRSFGTRGGEPFRWTTARTTGSCQPPSPRSGCLYLAPKRSCGSCCGITTKAASRRRAPTPARSTPRQRASSG